ncbi:winged helix-turn-helix transcriptional regulator [Amycolatopsis acidiphila]|uniref:HxlR family transcriptional regulator n=1 Tax=Amycolatopsis acidiphila TaxID=715473 RepID=A0A558A2X8_9PSEU|nr:winged helix-turn-helix transcriptional regulator [Amycolatopsis acidiphila]TVT18613.1 HxlR family transcriptional regulator [Amycolatopsis acidiphila]UIJ56595.1 winged helix-turn-helix transcriptional regulator [Amycolatopsis acidiphila]GHG66482.1 HxlR family transcriptional regulator [Amycolatopsis acidiphila]
MPTSRSYQEACGIARALDVVGERWALLVVRELLFGPQRFSVLRKALPAASTNLLTDRLRELEGNGVLHRRRVDGAWVYELTEWGRRLEPILLALGGWGLRVPLPPGPALNATSVMIFLRGVVRPGPEASYRIELDGRVWTVRTGGGEVSVAAGEPAEADASIRTDPATLNELLSDAATLDTAVSDGRVVVTGSLPAFRRLVRSAVTP